MYTDIYVIHIHIKCNIYIHTLIHIHTHIDTYTHILQYIYTYILVYFAFQYFFFWCRELAFLFSCVCMPDFVFGQDFLVVFYARIFCFCQEFFVVSYGRMFFCCCVLWQDVLFVLCSMPGCFFFVVIYAWMFFPAPLAWMKVQDSGCERAELLELLEQTRAPWRFI